MRKYKVFGKFEGKKVNEIVSANSKKQAKLMAGYNAGFGGSSMKGFMKSGSIKVREKK